MKFKFIPLLLLIFSCDSAQEGQKIEKYFDTNSELENIIEFNNVHKPQVNKVWEYKGNVDSSLVTDIDWEKELKLFLESDLNKSSYIMSYDSVRTHNRIVYTLKENEKLPIVELEVGIDSIGKMVSMRSVRKSENYFFNMGSEIELSVENGKLKSYIITSAQKLLWLDVDSTKIRGTIE